MPRRPRATAEADRGVATAVAGWRRSVVTLAMLLPRLPHLSLGIPGSAELAGRIAAALSEPPEPLASAVLLERHGAVAVGADPDHAVNRLELVEVLCRTWRDALLIRAARASLAIVETPSPGS